MLIHFNPKQFFQTLRFFLKIIVIWPPKVNATQNEILMHRIKWWIAFINVSALFIPLTLGVYYFSDDSTKITKTLSELTALSEIFLNLIQCKVMEKNFQIILHEIEIFIKIANEEEEKILQKYIDRYKNFQIFVVSSFIFTAVLFTCIPIVTQQELPADAWYPFSIESRFIRTFLYALQVLAIFHTGLGIFVDIMIATMLWYIAAQIELLERQVSIAENDIQLKVCARRYQKLMIFKNNVMKGIRFIVFKSNVMMTVAVVCGAFQLIQHQPIEVTARFVLMVIAGCFRLYLSAQPANDLKENNEKLEKTTFYVALEQKSHDAAKTGLMLASQCQKPIILSVTGFFKAYTLQYYAKFLSKTVSYFINLRAILEK